MTGLYIAYSVRKQLSKPSNADSQLKKEQPLLIEMFSFGEMTFNLASATLPPPLAGN